MSQNINESQSPAASISSHVRDNKRRARGDEVPSTYMRNGVEVEDTGLKYLILFQSGQYDVVGERDIHIDGNDDKWGIVYDKSKPFAVEIKCRGNLELVSRRAKLFGYNLPILTAEEDDSLAQLKIIEERVKQDQLAHKQLKRDTSKAKFSKDLYSDEGGENDDIMNTILPPPPKTKKFRSSTAPATHIPESQPYFEPISLS